MEKEEIKEGILHLLQRTSSTGDGMGWTFLEIRELLKINNVKGYFEDTKESWKKLKDLLKEMEEEGLIEERHFGEVLSGRVDFSIEQKGIDWIKKRRKELKHKGIRLENKWKLI